MVKDYRNSKNTTKLFAVPTKQNAVANIITKENKTWKIKFMKLKKLT